MSDFLRVFCQSDQSIDSSEIIDFIVEGCYFDETPRFEVRFDGEGDSKTDWKSLTVHYLSSKRPITLERNVNDVLLNLEVKETIKIIALSEKSHLPTDLVNKLVASKQVIAVEIDPVGLTDDGWAMLDCLEVMLASRLSGIIYAPDDGFYDPKLQPLYKLKETGGSTNFEAITPA